MNSQVKSIGVKGVDQSEFVVALAAFLKRFVFVSSHSHITHVSTKKN